ncbi:MAG: OmpA family protein [Flavobacteriales bacterium]|nr:OmpA family protein [Flavobacteriales bacterium]
MIKRLGALLLLVITSVFAFAQTDITVSLFGGNEGVEIEILFEVHKPKIKGFNTEFSELAPIIRNNNLIFTSDQDYHYHALGEDAWSKTGFYNIFTVPVSKMLDSSGYTRPKLFADELVINDNCGPISFSADGTEAFITMAPNKRAHRNNDHHLHLYHAVETKGKWHKFDVPFPQQDYAYGHGSLSPDGKRLYFAAELPTGKGGKDIYYIERGDSATKWSEPIMLGDEVNTSADELFPYLFKSDLYFASTHEDGFGGMDIYRSTLKDGVWSVAENLGETINSDSNDFSLVFNNDMSYAFFASDRDGNDDIFYADIIVSVKKKTIAGVFVYKNLKGKYPAGLEVFLVDDDGNIVFQTTTDEKGEFRFENLPPDKSYKLKLFGGSDDVVVKIIDGDKEIYLLSNAQGEFLFRKLDADNVGTLAMMEIEDGAIFGKMSGQFVYDKLPSQNAAGLIVYLIDDDGNIVMQTTTDENGNFNFENLPTDKNYMVKMSTEEDVSLIVFNSKNDVIAQLKQNENGVYTYKRLNADYNQTLNFLDEEDTEYDLSETVFGQFKRKDTLPLLNPIMFEIYLAETKDFLMKSITDAKGFFRLNNLPADKQLLYKILSEDGEMTDYVLLLKNRNGETVVEMVKGDDQFYYMTLESDKDRTIAAINTEDDSEMNIENISDSGLGDELPKMYFATNSSYLSQDMYPGLHKLIDLMKNNPSIKVELITHSDARGDISYNLWMTERRSQRLAQYLINQGIAQDRIKTEALGESALSNNCSDETECTEEEHRMNRIVDVTIF